MSGISFAAADSDVLCIAGRHGVGKTTLLKALMGLHKIDEGHVSIDGELLSQASAFEFRRQIISYLPQSTAFGSLTVGDVARQVYSIEANKGKTMSRAQLSDEWKSLGIAADTYSRRLSELTASQRQRAMVAIVCMQNKPIVIIDEADAGLDHIEAKALADYLRARAQGGQTVIVATSSDTFAESVATNQKRVSLL